MAAETATRPRLSLDQSLEAAFEQAAVGLALLSPEGQVLRANAEMARLLGYSPEHLVEIALPELVSFGQQVPQVGAGASEVAERYQEASCTRSDGTQVWLGVSASPVTDGAGELLHYVVAAWDATSRVEALFHAEDAANRYRAICDNVDDLISVSDMQGNLLYASGACHRLLGYAPEELVGRSGFDFIHPEDHAALAEVQQRAVVGALDQIRIRHRVRRRDGTYLWMETYARTIPGAHGYDRELVSVSRDVQEQHEAQLARLEEKHRVAEQPGDPTGDAELRDELTGLKSRAAMDEYLSGKLSSPRQSSYPIGILLVDIDDFKKIGDVYGETLADDVLRRIAQLLKDTCRAEDFVGRYGEDEFIVILPNTNPPGTIVVGEKLIRKIRMAYWGDTALQEPVTVSIGGTCLSYGHGLALPELLEIIDAQLNQAQEHGRDRMVMNAQATAGQFGR